MKGVAEAAVYLAAKHAWDTTYGGVERPAWKGCLESVVHEMCHAQLLGRPTAQTHRTQWAARRTIGELISDLSDADANRHEALTLATEALVLRALGILGVPMLEIVRNANFRGDTKPFWREDAYREGLRDPRAHCAAAAVVRRFRRAARSST